MGGNPDAPTPALCKQQLKVFYWNPFSAPSLLCDLNPGGWSVVDYREALGGRWQPTPWGLGPLTGSAGPRGAFCTESEDAPSGRCKNRPAGLGQHRARARAEPPGKETRVSFELLTAFPK